MGNVEGHAPSWYDMKKPSTLQAMLTPSLADIFFIVIFLSLFFASKSKLLLDGDTGYHIRTGEYILRTHTIPTFDIFSEHTPPIPWTAHEWLSEVIMGAIHSQFGLTGVVTFFAALIALTIAVLFAVLKADGVNLLIAALVTLLVQGTSGVHWLARPHVFSLLLMVVFHYLLESWRRGRFNRLYLLPPIMLVWVNLHGGFMGGFVLIGAYLIGALVAVLSAAKGDREPALGRLRQLALALGACLAACLVNPRGYHILLFPFRLISDSYIMDHISEFMSPDMHHVPFFKLLLLLMVALLALSRERLEATDVVLVVLFTDMGLTAGRYIPLFALVTAPIVARKADELRSLIGGKTAAFFAKRSENLASADSQSVGHLWPLAAICLVAFTAGSGRVQHGFDPQIKAVGACEFMLKERIVGNMFSSDNIGNYIIYRAYPAYKVYFDGRSDMYGTDFIKEYYRVITFQPGWEKILDKHRVSWIVFDTDSDFSRFLLNQREWRLIYSDKLTSIFVKNVPQNEGLIQKYGNVQPAVYEVK